MKFDRVLNWWTAKSKQAGCPVDKLQVNIYGSCATRDPLTHFPDEIAVKKYSARSSLASLVSPAPQQQISLKTDQNRFLTRTASEDILKVWRSQRPFPEFPEVYDFVDERNGLIDLGDTYITNSAVLKKVVVDYEVLSKSSRIIDPLSLEFRQIIDSKIDLFCEVLNERGSVIVNACYWCDVDDLGNRFSESEKKLTDTMNGIFESIYERISKKTKARFFGIPRPNYIARHDHRWGRSPFHWTIETEKEIGDALIKLLRS